MRFPPSPLIASLALLAMVSGCSRSQDARAREDAAHSSRLHRSLEGTLTDIVTRHSTSAFLDDCERAQLPIRLEIAKALDARKGEIEGYSEQASLAGDDDEKTVAIGPAKF